MMRRLHVFQLFDQLGQAYLEPYMCRSALDCRKKAGRHGRSDPLLFIDGRLQAVDRSRHFGGGVRIYSARADSQDAHAFVKRIVSLGHLLLQLR